MLSTNQKITAVTGAALLTIGLAGPAFANGSTVADPTAGGNHAPQHVAPTLAQVQAWITKKIDHRLAVVAKVEARVMANTTMTAAQKTAATTRLAARSTALLDLKAKVAAATSTTAVAAAVRAFVATGAHLFRDGDLEGLMTHRDAVKHAAVHAASAHAADPSAAARKATTAGHVAGRDCSATSWGQHLVSRTVSRADHALAGGQRGFDHGTQWSHGGGSHR